jgi:ankyrin repeat protein
VVADRYGETPLHAAVARDRGEVAEVVGMLVAKGASASVKGERSYTPLMDAVAAGRTDVVKTLLARTAALPGEERDLLLALAQGNPEMAGVIQEHPVR